jgi:hypothetical protein
MTCLRARFESCVPDGSTFNSFIFSSLVCSRVIPLQGTHDERRGPKGGGYVSGAACTNGEGVCVYQWGCVMFRLGLVVLLELFIQTTIGTVFVHISYFPHARCVVSCVVSCVGHVLCCALLRCSMMF